MWETEFGHSSVFKGQSRSSWRLQFYEVISWGQVTWALFGGGLLLGGGVVVTIYQTLCILIDELNVSKFNEIMDQFIKYWGEKEPSFINYFKQYYKNHPGQ